MRVLGIKPSLGNVDVFRMWGVHDGGACLAEDGELVAAASEERFTRDKRAENTFPSESIEFVLDYADISLSEVDSVAIGRDPKKMVNLAVERLRRNPSAVIPGSAKEALDYLEGAKAVTAAYNNIDVYRVNQHLEDLDRGSFEGDYRSISHHRCHAASASYCAPFDRPLTITVDGRGEHDSTVVWDRHLNRVQEFSLRNSIGLFYSYGTQYLGYRHGGDAGKVMGLAPYGEPREEFKEAFESLTSFSAGAYDVSDITDADDPTSVFEDHFGPRRAHPEDFTQRHRDFAYHLQSRTEEIVTHLVEHYVRQQGVSEVALAGGVAMNCKLNREILALDCVDELFIQPAADDSGICLGAALEGHHEAIGEPPDPEFKDVYLGPEYSEDEIKATLEGAKLEYERPEDISREAAELLAEGKLVGWYQGRMEFGARALGNRSILADPRTNASLDRVNANVKNREAWRPFAPSLLIEERESYLEGGEIAPYMILLDSVRDGKRDEIPAVTHVDNTTRPHTVRENVNPRYYRLISEFENLTGVPVVLNTSFNVAGEPIVESPAQAIQDFYSTGLDALALGEFLLRK